MSKRKTPENLNGPKAKRQKLMHETTDNRVPTVLPQSIGTSRIHATKSCINAHCYNNDVTTLQSPLIEIKKHHRLSHATADIASLSTEEFDALCSTIHQRVKVYWAEDKQWYYGTIQDFKPSTKESLIVYDDDESEWLNLTTSGHETVEFLYDTPPSAALRRNTKLQHIAIGQKLSSGRVTSTFNHGFIANMKHHTSTNVTSISFDTECIKHVLQQDSITNSMDVVKLLHFCRFDETMTTPQEDETNGHSPSSRKRKRSSSRIDNEMKQNQDNSRYNNMDIPPWIAIGCTTESDPVTQADDASHITLIHGNDKGSKANKRSWRKYDSTSGKNKSKSKSKSNKKHEPHIYNKNVGRNNNNITKKCNTRAMIDLKAVYPLQVIREQNHNKKRKIIVIGAGISGLSCSRELMNYGYEVVVLEARGRAGGRILTDYTLGLDAHHGCDVGGGWIHGIERNPLTRLVERLKLTLHSTSGTIQMFDADGHEVEQGLDAKVEKEFNDVLDRISKENEARFKRIHGPQNKGKMNHKQNKNVHHSSLGEALDQYLTEKKKKKMSAQEYNLWNWHFSNLEYSNATDLRNLSLTDWDQDDEYAFNGDHCLVQEGYGTIIHALKQGIDVRYNQIVTKIDWTNSKIKVWTKQNGSEESKENDDENEDHDIMDVNEDASTVSSSSIVNKEKEGSVMNNNINIGYDASVTPCVVDHVTHIELSKVNETDLNQDTTRVPIYAMLPKSNDSVQLVKLQDIEGHCHLDREAAAQSELDVQPNGHSVEEEEDNDIQMEPTEIDATASQEDEQMEYEADAVVVTLPLGILKDGDVEFVPSLPPWKQHAIDKIGYGLLNKVFLKFESVFWDINNDYVGYASSHHGEFYLFVNLVPVSGTPVLMSLVSGSFARKLEEKSDDEIVEYAMKILRNIFAGKHHKKNKNKKIPDPIDSYVTKWGKDRFSKGSYSYIAMGSNGDHYDKLSYSVKDKVYFAGEATIRKWPASVHGAYLSGIREARKIMNNHYIHNDTPQPHKVSRGRKRKKSACNVSPIHASTPLSRVGLSEFPTDTIFKPVKDIAIRMSSRKNLGNRYSSKYNKTNRKQKKKKTLRAKRMRRGSGKRNEDAEDDGDISSMSETSSITSSAEEEDEELYCTLCGGSGYVSDDVLEDETPKRNANQKLIGPFILNSDETETKIYIHFGCGQWSPDIHNQDNVWYNVISCIKRSKYIRCCYCGEYGASVHCHNKHCLSSYHPECAHTTQYWDFNRPDEGPLFFCIKHRENMLSLHVQSHQTKVASSNKNLKNELRQPRPPKIRT